MVVIFPKRRLCWSALSVALCALSANAEWQAVPTVGLNAASQDNPRLQTDDQPSETSSSMVLNASLDLSTYNERGYAIFAPRVESYVFADNADQELESDDWFLRGRGEYRWQVVTLGFRSDYQERAIRNAELVDIDDPVFDPDGNVIENPDDVTSGRLVFLDQTQERFTLRPYMNFRLSERSTLRFQLASTEVSYSGGSTIVRTGFDNRSIEAGVVRRVDEQNQVSATLIASDYEADANANQTDTIGVQGAILRRVSDIWTVGITAGVQRSDYVFVDPITLQTVDNAEVSPTLGVRATKRSERSTLDFAVDRVLSPSSSGFLNQRHEFRVYLNHALTERLSGRFGVRLSDNKSVGEAAPINDREYMRFEMSFDWGIRPRWVLTGGYHHIGQEFTQGVGGEATSDMLYIGVGYRGLSRPEAPRSPQP
jgi:hypothetical protein